MDLLDQVSELRSEASLPRMVRVRQHFDAPVVADIDGTVARELAPFLTAITPGSRVGITAGSRGIANIGHILRAIGDAVRAHGGDPFIIPAMGSHGGATADGQTEVLHSYGISPETTGMQIVSSMEVREIAHLGDDHDRGPTVFMSETALAADGLIICGRVKPHTDFRGPVESGLAKIMTIGLGKHRGAQTVHAYGTRGLAHWMPRAAQAMVQVSGTVLAGLAILENAYDQTARLVGVEASEIGGAGEAALLEEAKGLMASLPFDDIDVLVVDEMGKNISGTGMDTNIIGRMLIRGVPEFVRPNIRSIVVRDLTDESHGNGAGIGLADIMTQYAARKLDLRATYINGLTSGIGGVQRVQLPIVMPTDVDAICASVLTCGRGDPENVRVVRIANTLEIGTIEVSETLLDAVRANPRLEILSAPYPWVFDASGNLPVKAPAHAAAH